MNTSMQKIVVSVFFILIGYVWVAYGHPLVATLTFVFGVLVVMSYKWLSGAVIFLFLALNFSFILTKTMFFRRIR